MRRLCLHLALILSLTFVLWLHPVHGQQEPQLHVLSTSPEDSATGINVNTPILITFDRPVVPLISTVNQADLPQPLTFDPPLDGVGEWINSAVYRFTPSEALQGVTAYSVRVADELRAVDGSRLSAPYSWTFTTLASQVLDITPTHVLDENGALLLESGFEIVFSQAMNRQATESAFSLTPYEWVGPGDGELYYSAPEPPVEGTFVWSEGDTRMTFIPTARLDYSMYYRAILNVTARTAANLSVIASSADRIFRALTTPQVVSSESPGNGYPGQAGRYIVRFAFATPMNTETLREHCTIEPTPNGEITPYVYDDRTFGIEFDWALDQPYTLTILPGVEDIYGTPMSEAYRVTVNVPPPPAPAESHVSVSGYSEIVLAGSYLATPSLPLTIDGTVTVTANVYRADVDQIVNLDYAGWQDYYRFYGDGSLAYAQVWNYDDFYGGWQTVERRLPWRASDRLVSTSERVFDSAEQQDFQAPMPLTQSDEGLPLGVYGVDLIAPNSFSAGLVNHSMVSRVLAVVNAAVTLKATSGAALIWVTDLLTAEPLAGVTVRAYIDHSRVIVARTDANGLIELPNNALAGYGNLFVVAESENTFGFWQQSAPQPDEGQVTNYLYTDRTTYRPGETVYFRGVLRDRDDMTYTVPAVETVYASVAAPHHDFTQPVDYLYLESLPVSEYGTVSGAVTLPDDVPLGYYSIFVNACDPRDAECRTPYVARASFTLTAFRVPEYEIAVTPQRAQIISGEPLNVDVSANYYFGGGLGSAQVSWAVRDYGTRWFQYRGDEQGFSFGNWELHEEFSNDLHDSAHLDANGHFIIGNAAHSTHSEPINVRVEATVSDESGQTISGSTDVIIHAADLYIGLRAERDSAGAPDEPIRVNVLTVDAQSGILPNQTVNLSVTEIRYTRHEIEFGRYEWQREESAVLNTVVTTDADGHAVYNFVPPNAGEFRVRAQGFDSAGRSNQSAIRVSTSTASIEPNFYDYNRGCSIEEYRTLRLTPDRTRYVPGDTAQIFIPNPYGEPVSALITVERAGVMTVETLRLEADALTYTLPLTDQHVPNVFISVVLVRGVSAESPDPQYIRGTVALTVEPVTRRLFVTLTSSAEIVAPGETVTFEVQVTDSAGNPVQAEVGFGLTDEAALVVANPWLLRTLEQTYYSDQRLNVSTSTAIARLLTTADNTYYGSCGYGGGGGGDNNPALRTDFVYTPLWATVVTDANGQGRVSLVMPDNLTRWRLDARAITADTRIGEAQLNITSTLPLVVRPITPRFLVVGDQVTLAAIVNNNTNQAQTVAVSLIAEGIAFDPVTGAQTVDIAPQSRRRVEWAGTVGDVPSVDVRVTAVAENGLGDAATPALGTIPVRRYVSPDVIATGGVLVYQGSRTEGIQLAPTASPLAGTLTIQLDPTLADGILGVAELLNRQPDESIEALVNRFYPQIILVEAGMLESINQASRDAVMALIEAQNPDGGWGWYPGMESEAYFTAYALPSVFLLRDRTGSYVDTADHARTYLESQLISPDIATQPETLNAQAYFLYALSTDGMMFEAEAAVFKTHLDALLEHRLQMSITGRAFLLLAYLEVNQIDSAFEALQSDLIGAATLSANGTHWEEAERATFSWDSDTHTTAITLLALLRSGRFAPQDSLLPNAVRWLMMARQGDLWQTPQESAWAVLALAEYLRLMRDMDSDYPYAMHLNGETVAQGDFAPHAEQQSVRIEIGAEALLPDALNTLEIERGEGTGILYYNASLHLDVPAATAPAINRGIGIMRGYFVGVDRQPVESAKMGDVVTVRIELYVAQDVHFFSLTDTLPAGLEVIDSSLRTEQQFIPDPMLERLDINDPFWFWGWQYFTQREVNDQGAVLRANYLPRGAYVFTYQARAITPGTFNVIPAQAVAVYQPEVFGSSAGESFLVNEQSR